MPINQLSTRRGSQLGSESYPLSHFEPIVEDFMNMKCQIPRSGNWHAERAVSRLLFEL